jgi:hypothetical protein
VPARHKKLLFLLFFLSGFCGLLYQVVWMRMSFASFGVITRSSRSSSLSSCWASSSARLAALRWGR